MSGDSYQWRMGNWWLLDCKSSGFLSKPINKFYQFLKKGEKRAGWSNQLLFNTQKAAQEQLTSPKTLALTLQSPARNPFRVSASPTTNPPQRWAATFLGFNQQHDLIFHEHHTLICLVHSVSTSKHHRFVLCSELGCAPDKCFCKKYCFPQKVPEIFFHI